MPQDLTDDKSTLVQVMVGYHQATSHYFNQCWPRSPTPCGVTRPHWVNSLAPGRCGNNFKSMMFKHILQIKFMGTCCEIALRWIPQNSFDNMSTLLQEMVWCCQATSHYLSQYRPRSVYPYGITKPQWVNTLRLWWGQNGLQNFVDDMFESIFLYCLFWSNYL